MNKRVVTLLAGCALFLVCSLLLLAKHSEPVASGGGMVIATATRNHGLVTVRIGGTNVFDVCEDFFGHPIFLYSFADTQRILCVYNYHIAILVFVVDASREGTNSSTMPRWPPNDYIRQQLARMTTNVVVGAKGVIRLPTCAEVQEASSKARSLGFGLRAAGFKRFVASALDTNRQSCWPTTRNEWSFAFGK